MSGSGSLGPNRRLTETALRLLVSASTHFAAEHGPERREHSQRWSTGPADTAAVQGQAAIMRIVTIVETYLDALSRELLGEHVGSHSPTTDLMVEDIALGATNTWTSREDIYRRYHRLKLRDLAGWKAIQAAVQIRNASAHGLGQLTQRQIGDQNIRTLLDQVDATIVDGRIHLGDESLIKIRTVAREFMNAVDAAFPPAVR